MTSAAADILPPPTPAQKPYRPYGAAEEMFYCKAPEVLLSGPAGTGKSRAILEKLHLCAEKYAGMRGLILRKTRISLAEAALQTFEERVVPDRHPILTRVKRRFRFGYEYPNGSFLAVGGLDKPGDVMSKEYDLIYIQEATESEEEDWENATSRLRNGRMPYQQLLADCNPDAPTHWLYQRCQKGQTLLLESRHEHNPSVTPAYLAVLDALTGVRYQRLRLGLWVAAEGIVYEGWDPAIHRVQRFPIPPDWTRYWVVDFGYTNPFVWQEWVSDGDGRLFRSRELYHTSRLVEDHAQTILAATTSDPRPRAIICDHDAEDRATLERHLKMGTVKAFKDVSPGIQAVATRLRPAGDGKPRLFFLRDSLIERDAELADKKKPCSTEEEFSEYVWDTSNNRKRGEEPVKLNDHGLDCTRYLVAYLDGLGGRFRAGALAGAARRAR